MSKFKVGDKVKWNDGKHYNNTKRIDVIIEVISDIWGDTRYKTQEVNNPPNRKPRKGIAYETYLVKAEV
jgi:hypothetical protein